LFEIYVSIKSKIFFLVLSRFYAAISFISDWMTKVFCFQQIENTLMSYILPMTVVSFWCQRFFPMSFFSELEILQFLNQSFCCFFSELEIFSNFSVKVFVAFFWIKRFSPISHSEFPLLLLNMLHLSFSFIFHVVHEWPHIMLYVLHFVHITGTYSPDFLWLNELSFLVTTISWTVVTTSSRPCGHFVLYVMHFVYIVDVFSMT